MENSENITYFTYVMIKASVT